MEPVYMDKDVCHAMHEGCKKSVAIRLNGVEEAIKQRAVEMERRLVGLNELRAEVVKDRAEFVKGAVFELKMAELDRLSDRMLILQTRYEGRITFATVLAVLSSIIAVLAVLVPWLLHRGG